MNLVDVCNAFNSLKRETALRNILHFCPPLAKILVNTYRDNVQLFIDGDTLLSLEGTTQGDPLAMAMYAVAITPFIRSFEDDEIKQVWFADDAAAGGVLAGLRRWWDLIVEKRPVYGYYPNPTKTCLVAKEENIKMVKKVFQRNRHLCHRRGQKTFRCCYWDSSFCQELYRAESV